MVHTNLLQNIQPNGLALKLHVEFTSHGVEKNTSSMPPCDSFAEFSADDAIGEITMNETTN